MNETLSNNPGEEQEGQNPAETLAEMPDFEEHLKEQEAFHERGLKALEATDNRILKDIAEDVGSEEVVFTPFRPEEPVPPPSPETPEPEPKDPENFEQIDDKIQDDKYEYKKWLLLHDVDTPPMTKPFAGEKNINNKTGKERTFTVFDRYPKMKGETNEEYGKRLRFIHEKESAADAEAQLNQDEVDYILQNLGL